jgi:hypothetical protein
MPAVHIHGVDADWVQFPAARSKIKKRLSAFFLVLEGLTFQYLLCLA